MYMCDEFITISIEEYRRLKRRDRELNALEAGGVDNWTWYDESMLQYFDEEYED